MAWQLVHENERLRDEVAVLRDAIRRLAEQDATLSVCEGNVTVTMDAILTDAERIALRTVIGGFGMWVAQNELADDESLRLAVVTLRGLLERCACDSDRPKPIVTPKQDTTPAQGSVQPECATAPGWMARPFWVDPPSGHRYGFPKLYDRAFDGDMTAWMIRCGYPEHLARQGLPCTFTAATDSQ